MADVKVKALEWEEARVSNRWERFTANTVVGSYEVLEWSNGGYGGTLPSAIPDEPGIEFSARTMQEAKACAQLDYERRISAALSPSPVGASSDVQD